MYNITVAVEKNDEDGFMSKDSIRLVEVGGQIAHTLTPRPGDINVQHCNLVIELRKLKTMQYTEVKMGVDLCNQHAELVDIANTIAARYDAGIINHKYEHTGVLEVNKLGNLGDIETQGRSVFDKEGISPTLIAGMDHGNTVPYITEEKKLMVAMRGRNPENPSDRKAGADLEQRLEVNDSDVANTLTTVQKDNLVLEEKAIKIRQADKQGYALCEIGGGSRPELCNKQYKARKSNRERKDLPDLDNGEYP